MLNPSSTGNTSIIVDFKLLIILLFIVTFLQEFLTILKLAIQILKKCFLVICTNKWFMKKVGTFPE